MREHSPSFDRTPISRERKRTQENEPVLLQTKKPKTSVEPQTAIEARIEVVREHAETIAATLEQTQNEVTPAITKPEPIRKETFVDRVRNFLRIPKSIASELQQLDENDVRAVDAFNADETQMPKIIRKPNKLSRSLLLGTALGAIGLTHEPQIESAAKESIQIAKQLEQDAEKTFDDVKDFLKRNKPFGKEAFAGERKNSKQNHDEEGGGDSNDAERRSKQIKGYDKLTKRFPHLSESQKQIAEDLLLEQERTYGNMAKDKFFLGTEFLHGQITQEQMEAAQTRLNEITDSLRDRLAPEQDALNDVVRVAFELSKQRTTYAREKADIYSIIMNHEGNCEALVAFELAAIPKVMGKTPSMAVQMYPDHVRLLVRNNPSDAWTWIDGHRFGTLSIEDMKGTLILNPDDVIAQALQLKDRAEKPPQEGSGYTTNSVLKWETPDGRIATKKHSVDPIPLRQDEKDDAKLTFKQASDRPEDHMRIVPVSVEFLEGNVEQPSSTEEEKIEEIKLAPSAKDVADALVFGSLNGRFNDLTPLEGISIEDIHIYSVDHASKKVDLAPLAASSLKKLLLDDMYQPTGFEKLSFKNLQTLSVDIHATEFLNKVLKESVTLEKIFLTLPTPSSLEQHMQIYRNGPTLSANEFNTLFADLEKKLTEQKKGEVHITIESPYENIVSVWTFDGKTKTWKIDGGDYLTPDARFNIQEAEKGKLEFTERLKNDSYLLEEKVDLSKITDILFEVKEERDDQDNTLLQFNKKLDALRKAKNLDTITIRIDTNIGELDLSSLNGLKYKKLIIEYEYLSNEKPQENIILKGLESNKIKIEYKR